MSVMQELMRAINARAERTIKQRLVAIESLIESLRAAYHTGPNNHGHPCQSARSVMTARTMAGGEPKPECSCPCHRRAIGPASGCSHCCQAFDGESLYLGCWRGRIAPSKAPGIATPAYEHGAAAVAASCVHDAKSALAKADSERGNKVLSEQGFDNVVSLSARIGFEQGYRLAAGIAAYGYPN